MSLTLNPITGKLDVVRGFGVLDGRYILKSPTVIDEAFANSPADYGWHLKNTDSNDGSGILLSNSEYGTALAIDLETYANFDPGNSGGFRGAAISVAAPVASQAAPKSTGALLRFSGKSGTNFLGVYSEFTMMHGPAGTQPRKVINCGGGFGEGAAGIGISKNAYYPGQFSYQSAHADITSYFGGGSAATNLLAQMHIATDYVDKSGRTRVARQCGAAITSPCGVSRGDENIFVVSNTVGMTAKIGQPVWPFNMDLGNFEYAYGQTDILGLNYGDSEQWNTPYLLYLVQEKGSRVASAANCTGTAGNTFVTTTAGIGGFLVGDLVRLRQGGTVRELQEIVGLTAGAPNQIDFARPIITNYTGAATQICDTNSTLGMIKVVDGGAYPYTGTKPFIERDYLPSDLNARGNDFVIVGELTSDTSGWLKFFGNPTGRGQIPIGLALIQIADTAVNDIRDNVQVTAAASPALVGGGHYVPLATVNVPAGTFTVNVVAAPVAAWDFMYSVLKYEMDR